MKIAVDGFGGDNAPQEIVKGCIMAVKERKDLSIVITGQKDLLEQLIKQEYYGDRISVYDCADVISCEEEPVIAIRKKKNSSLVKAFELLKQGEADGVVSAGSTGAVLAGGVFILGRIDGVLRPCLVPELPTVKGGFVALADCGANVDCKPEYICQFAKMAAIYHKALHGEEARIGLLNNGVESTKGNETVKAAYGLLKDSGLNFVGNCEARDILSGDFDVVACDGFDGNVALKSAEGTANAVFTLMKEAIYSSSRAKIGALLMKPALKGLKKKLDYSEHGGAAFIGVKYPLVKCHGSSKAKSICAGILQCHAMAENKLCDNIAQAFVSND